jgi:hypothetical protein
MNSKPFKMNSITITLTDIEQYVLVRDVEEEEAYKFELCNSFNNPLFLLTLIPRF